MNAMERCDTLLSLYLDTASSGKWEKCSFVRRKSAASFAPSARTSQVEGDGQSCVDDGDGDGEREPMARE